MFIFQYAMSPFHVLNFRSTRQDRPVQYVSNVAMVGVGTPRQGTQNSKGKGNAANKKDAQGQPVCTTKVGTKGHQ